MIDVSQWLSSFVGAAFLAAFLLKLLGKGGSLPVLIDAGIPPQLARVLDRSIMPLDGLMGGLLLSGIFVPGAILLPSAFIIAGLVVLSTAIHKGSEAGCGCFGGTSTESLTVSLLRSLVLLLALALSWTTMLVDSGWILTRPAGPTITLSAAVAALSFIASLALGGEVVRFLPRAAELRRQLPGDYTAVLD